MYNRKAQLLKSTVCKIIKLITVWKVMQCHCKQ